MKCKRCGKWADEGNYCYECLGKFAKVRLDIWNYHEKKYGRLIPENIKLRKKDAKKLTNIWRENPKKFGGMIK